MTTSGDPDPLAALSDEARRGRRVPAGSACAVCWVTDHLSRGPDRVVRCYGHSTIAAGKSSVELDHVAGRVNLGGFLVPLEANAHRSVTDIRRILGMDEWPPAGGDPLLAAAHAIGGIATIVWLIARWLVDMSAWLRAKFGASWWEGAPPFPIARGSHDGQ